jgi:hypothetical protein
MALNSWCKGLHKKMTIPNEKAVALTGCGFITKSNNYEQ